MIAVLSFIDTGSVAFAGFISLGFFFWRLSLLLKKRVVEAPYEETSDGDVVVITKKGVSDTATHDRRNIRAALWLFVQHLLMLVPIAAVVGAIRYNNFGPLDGGAAILLLIFVGAFLLHKGHSEKNPNPKSGRGVFTYNERMVEGLAVVAVLFVIAAIVTKIYFLILAGIIPVAAMMMYIAVRNRKAVNEHREDNPLY